MGTGGHCKLSFCNERVETRDHIFFTYDYSKQLWKEVLLACSIDGRVGDWHTELGLGIGSREGSHFIHTEIGMVCIHLSSLEGKEG